MSIRIINLITSLLLANSAYAEQADGSHYSFLSFVPLITLIVAIWSFIKWRKKQAATSSAQANQVAQSNNNPLKTAGAVLLGIVIISALTDKEIDKGKSKSTESTSGSSLQVTGGSGLKNQGFYVRDCKLESAHRAKCILVAYGNTNGNNTIYGANLTATASKMVADSLISVSDPLISAPTHIHNTTPSEITIIMPEGTDLVTIDYRI